MSIKENIQNMLAKINNNETEYAVIFKSIKEENDAIAYVPVGIVSGKLDEESMSFTCKKRSFNHLIKGPKDYGFAFSKTLTEAIRSNRLVPSIVHKKTLLKSLSNFLYVYGEDENNTPVIGVQVGESSDNVSVLYEDELLNYYMRNFPKAKDIISLLKKASGKLNLDISDISTALEDTFTNCVQAKQILTGIWKHFHSSRPYHIFVNGSDITPKKEIVISICECANIPYYYVKAVDNYEIFDLENLLKKILDKFNNDLEAAQNIVLIIDNIDKLALTDLSAEAFAQGQLSLAKILCGKEVELSFDKYKVIAKKIKFDTSRIMVIGMGDFRDDELKNVRISGFSSHKKEPYDEKEKYKYGMLEGLFNYFDMMIQMDDPSLKDYQTVLTSREEAGLVSNNTFFNNLGVNLNISEEMLSKIARYAYDNHMTIADIRGLVEKMLADASYRVAKSPEDYEELVVSDGMLEDNKKYVLERKKNQDEKKED